MTELSQVFGGAVIAGIIWGLATAYKKERWWGLGLAGVIALGLATDSKANFSFDLQSYGVTLLGMIPTKYSVAHFFKPRVEGANNES